MLAVVFLVLLVTCLTAPWLGADSRKLRRDPARPELSWYPVDTTR